MKTIVVSWVIKFGLNHFLIIFVKFLSVLLSKFYKSTAGLCLVKNRLTICKM